MEENSEQKFDAIMLLEPSAPFATSTDFDNAVELMLKHDASAVIGMRKTEVHSNYVAPMDDQGRISELIKKVEDFQYMRRQDMRDEYTANGALYLFKWELFKKHHTMYA